jgi:hypothetical protein
LSKFLLSRYTEFSLSKGFNIWRKYFDIKVKLYQTGADKRALIANFLNMIGVNETESLRFRQYRDNVSINGLGLYLLMRLQEIDLPNETDLEGIRDLTQVVCFNRKISSNNIVSTNFETYVTDLYEHGNCELLSLLPENDAAEFSYRQRFLARTPKAQAEGYVRETLKLVEDVDRLSVLARSILTKLLRESVDGLNY